MVRLPSQYPIPQARDNPLLMSTTVSSSGIHIHPRSPPPSKPPTSLSITLSSLPSPISLQPQPTTPLRSTSHPPTTTASSPTTSHPPPPQPYLIFPLPSIKSRTMTATPPPTFPLLSQIIARNSAHPPSTPSPTPLLGRENPSARKGIS